MLSMDDHFRENEDQLEFLDLVIFSFEFLQQEDQKKDQMESCLESLHENFSTFISHAKLIRNLSSLWKIAPKNEKMMVVFSRVLMIVSLMETENFDFLLDAELVNIFRDIFTTKHEVACVDLLFAASNLVLSNDFYLLFIQDNMFNCILEFLYCDK